MVHVRCVVAAQSCEAPISPKHGHRHETDCTGPYFYRDTCQFVCDDGYQFPSGGVTQIKCDVEIVAASQYMQWDKRPADCEGNYTVICTVTKRHMSLMDRDVETYTLHMNVHSKFANMTRFFSICIQRCVFLI